jgi:hypothetical protein
MRTRMPLPEMRSPLLFKADSHVTTLNARMPEVKNARSQRVLKLVAEAEALCRSRGEHLLASVREAWRQSRLQLIDRIIQLLIEPGAEQVLLSRLAPLTWPGQSGEAAVQRCIVCGNLH